MSLFGGKDTVNRAEKISSFSVNTAEYGAPVMEVVGTTRISGNVIYYNDFKAHEHRETQRAGKGGGSKTTTITYTYTVAVILGLCEGEISNIGKVWIGKELYDYPNEKIGLTLFKGSQNQAPWSYLTGKHPEQALSYPGLAYMAGVIDLGNNGSMPTFNFEVKGKLLNKGDGTDVNPADYILYVLDRIGMGDVAVDGIDNYRNYCNQANLLISTPYDATGTQEAHDIINDIAMLTNAAVFWSNDSFKIVPLADRPVGNWQPNKTIIYDLTPDDFLPQEQGAAVTYARKDSSEIYNRFTVEFLNRSNGYEKESVSFEDTADIIAHGVRQAPTVKAHYIYTKERAVKIAEEQDVKINTSAINTPLSWDGRSAD
ncbi:MAG: phage tail protein [Phascolarctobacterium sp.]|nr:phage tail protein [Phascolarctobacterium sp.]